MFGTVDSNQLVALERYFAWLWLWLFLIFHLSLSLQQQSVLSSLWERSIDRANNIGGVLFPFLIIAIIIKFPS